MTELIAKLYNVTMVTKKKHLPGIVTVILSNLIKKKIKKIKKFKFGIKLHLDLLSHGHDQ